LEIEQMVEVNPSHPVNLLVGLVTAPQLLHTIVEVRSEERGEGLGSFLCDLAEFFVLIVNDVKLLGEVVRECLELRVLQILGPVWELERILFLQKNGFELLCAFDQQVAQPVEYELCVLTVEPLLEFFDH